MLAAAHEIYCEQTGLNVQVTRQQVEQFLDAVHDLKLSTNDESTLEVALAHNAQMAREAVLRCFDVVLPTDASGARVLDDLLNAMHDAMRPSLIKRLIGGQVSIDAKAVSASLGAHLCELVQLNTPGKWGYAEFRGVREVVLVLSPGNFMAVPQKTGKQFVNGKSDSIELFFGLAAAFAKGRARIANMSPDERQALKDKVAGMKAASKARKAMLIEAKKVGESGDERNRKEGMCSKS